MSGGLCLDKQVGMSCGLCLDKQVGMSDIYTIFVLSSQNIKLWVNILSMSHNIPHQEPDWHSIMPANFPLYTEGDILLYNYIEYTCNNSTINIFY